MPSMSRAIRSASSADRASFDAAALSAAARVNLRLDDDHAAAEMLGDLARVGGGGRHFPARDGHAVALEDGFCLVLVNFHAGKRLIVICGRADRQLRVCAGDCGALDSDG